MKTTPHPDIAPTTLPGNINQGVVCHCNAMTQHIHAAAFGTRRRASCQHLAVALHIGVARGAQNDFAALQVRRNRLNQPAVAQRARKNTYRITFERAQVERLVRRGLHLQRDAFQPAPGNLHTLPGRQRHTAALGFDHGSFGQVDRRRNQHHVAAARNNVARHRERTGVGVEVTAGKTQASSHGVGVGHAQRGGRKTRCIDQRPRAHRNTRLIDQDDPAVALQSAKQL